MTGRYCYCPAAGKIRGLKKPLRARLLRWFRQRYDKPDVYPVCGFEPACYPMKKTAE